MNIKKTENRNKIANQENNPNQKRPNTNVQSAEPKARKNK